MLIVKAPKAVELPTCPLNATSPVPAVMERLEGPSTVLLKVTFPPAPENVSVLVPEKAIGPVTTRAPGAAFNNPCQSIDGASSSSDVPEALVVICLQMITDVLNYEQQPDQMYYLVQLFYQPEIE